MNRLLRTVNICAACYLLLAIVGILLSASTKLSEKIGFAYGYASILSAIIPAILIARQVGAQKSILCIIAASVAPIWFLYLEGVIQHDETAYILPSYMRVKGYSYALIYQAITFFIYTVALRWIARHSKNYNQKIEKVRLPLWQTNLATILAFFIPLVVIGLSYSSLNELWEALTAGRSEGGSGTLLRSTKSTGGSDAILMPFMWLWQLTPAVAGISVVIDLKKNHFITPFTLFAAACGLAVAFFTFLGGSRGTLIFVLAVPLMLWFYYGVKMGLRFWIISICGFFVFIGIMEFQVRTRGNMLTKLEHPEWVSASDGKATTFNPLKSHRDNNLYFTCLIVDKIPDVFPYEGFNDYFAILVNPIPRSVWPGKPILNGAKVLAKDAKPVYSSGPLIVGTASLSASVVGQSYEWHGILGFLPLAMIYACFAAWFDSWFLYTRVPTLIHIALQGFAAFMIFWGFRDFGAFITFIYPFILLYILSLVRSYFQSSNSRKNQGSQARIKIASSVP